MNPEPFELPPTKRTTRVSKKAAATLVEPLESERKLKKRTPAQLAREEASRSTQGRIAAAAERSQPSSSKVQLGSPRPSDLIPEVEGASTSQLEPEPVQSAVQPEPITVQPVVQTPSIVSLPTSLPTQVSSNPINPINTVTSVNPKMAAAFKVPWGWDRNAPRFDGKTADNLQRFLRFCKTIVSEAKITDADEQRRTLLDYIEEQDIREQFKLLPSYQGGTFEEWCAEIETLYPEIEDREIGSLEKLFKICETAKGITQQDLGAVRRFSMAFSNEAEKLLRPPASITNKVLVEKILDSLEPNFANSVETMMNHKLIMENTTAATAPLAPAASASTGSGTGGSSSKAPATGTAAAAVGPGGVQRRGDRIHYKKALEIAEKIADTWSGRSALSVSLGLGLLNARANSTETSLLQGGSSAGLPKDVAGKLESFDRDLAGVKDSQVLLEKQVKELTGKMGDTIKTSIKESMAQYSRDTPPHLDNQQSGGTSSQVPDRSNQRYQENNRPMACYFCNGPHMIRDCPLKEEYITIGWLKIENGRMKMGDGSFIPRYPEHKSRKDRIDDYYGAKGFTKNQAGRARSNLMQGQGGYYDPRVEEDNLDYHYDSRADELLSNQVQSTMMANNHQPQYQQMLNQGPVSAAPAVAPPAQNQFAQAPAAAPGVLSMTTTQFAELLNACKVAGSAPQQEAQEQLLTTRTGRNVQGPEPRSF